MSKRTRKGLLSGIVLMMTVVVFSIATPVAASTGAPGGDVSGTWTVSGLPYLINGDITVPAGQTLTIEPGVVVNFESAYDLTDNGTFHSSANRGLRLADRRSMPKVGQRSPHFL